MEVGISKEGDLTIVELKGRLDASSAPSLEMEFGEHLQSGVRAILVDCSGLSYVSSAGLRVFLTLAKKMRQVSGKVALAALQSHVHDIFQIAGFEEIIPILPGRDEARKSLGVGMIPEITLVPLA